LALVGLLTGERPIRGPEAEFELPGQDLAAGGSRQVSVAKVGVSRACWRRVASSVAGMRRAWVTPPSR